MVHHRLSNCHHSVILDPWMNEVASISEEQLMSFSTCYKHIHDHQDHLIIDSYSYIVQATQKDGTNIEKIKMSHY
ncbi:MAG: hypothetical protein KIT56_07615 [Gammaproteobacteria bacterium]|nr:hypothetical protein [Gammaproteobacteria bacterium]MCW5583727.1 hypothetical protein [Gammaproteobacteria bacterium]